MKTLLRILAVLLLAAPASAASVNVSTIAVAASTVTVTTGSAHGLTVNAGFCLSVGVCSAAETVPTSTTFTFTQPSNQTVAACASSCGTGSAAPRIVILDVQQPSQAQQLIHYLLWLTTTKPIPRSGATSAWAAAVSSAGPSTAQTAALAAGSFIEANLSQAFPSSLSTAAIQTFLQNDWSTRQAALVANTQPGTYYGTVYDGSAWAVQ